MKKIFLCFCLLLTLTLCGCNKELPFNDVKYNRINYYYVGLYIEVDKVENKSLEDINPKVYFEMDRDLFNTSSGFGESAMNFNLSSRTVKEENGVKIYHGQVTGSLTSSDVKKVTLYAITYDGNNYKIETDNSETIKKLSDYTYKYRVYYTKDKQDYELTINLNFE